MNNTKKCPYCAEEIKSAAIKCKHCKSTLKEDEGLKSKGNSRSVDIVMQGLMVVFLAVFFLISLGILFLNNSEVNNNTSKPGSSCSNKVDRTVIRYAEGFVEDRLKSPSTADFGDANVNEFDDCKYRVRGSVDAENSFGAKLRNNYRVELKYDNKTWYLEDISIY